MEEKKLSKEKELEMLREATGDPSVEIIGLDDTFDFECQQCGRCCMHRGDIIINPFDVFNAAKYLGITCEEFIVKYTTADYGGQSRIPMVLLASDKKNHWCPLLKFDVKDGAKFKCMVHGAKPGACWNHPIGVVRESSRDIDSVASQEKVKYIKVDQCDNSKGHNHPQLVRDWVKPSLDHAEEIKVAHILQTYVEKYFSARLFDFIFDLLGSAKDDAPDDIKKASSEIFQIKKEFFMAYLSAVYINYDTNKPFVEQAKENMKALDGILTETRSILKDICSSMPDPIKVIVKTKLKDEHCLDFLEED